MATNEYLIEERGLVTMKGKGQIKTYWLVDHIDGPRIRSTDNQKRIKHANFQISLFDEDVMGKMRKGSLVSESIKGSLLPTNIHRRAMLNNGLASSSLAKIASKISSSCSGFRTSYSILPTFEGDKKEITKKQAGHKPGKSGWKLFSGKTRSSSTKESSDPQQIFLKDKPVSRKIIKSPSYNAIESYAHRYLETEILALKNWEEPQMKHFNANLLIHYDDSGIASTSNDKPMQLKLHKKSGLNTKSVNSQFSMVEEVDDENSSLTLNRTDCCEDNETGKSDTLVFIGNSNCCSQSK